MKRRVNGEPEPVIEGCPFHRISERLARMLQAHSQFIQRGKSTENQMSFLLEGKSRFAVDTSQVCDWMKKRIKDLQPQYPADSIFADIIYIHLRKGFAYLAIVADLHTGRIIGFDLSMSLAAEGCIRALTMALAGIAKDRQIIHYSDRGIQYRCHEYVKLIEERNGTMRITTNGKVYARAMDERVNGILKTEFSLDRDFENLKQAKKFIAAVIRINNKNRRQKNLGVKPRPDHFSKNEQAA